MKLLCSSYVAAILIAGSVSTAIAQDGAAGKLKEKAVNMAVDEAKTEVKSQAGDVIDTPIADKAIDMGADMAKGTSVKDAAQDVVMKGATSNAKGMATERMPGGGTIKTTAPNVTASSDIIMQAPQPVPMTAPVSAPAASPLPVKNALPINCPSGTTAQPNGTCMITGNYQG